MTPTDLDALLGLVAAGGRAAPRRRLLEACRTPAEAMQVGQRAWRMHGLDDTQCQRLRAPGAEIDAARRWLALPDHHLVGWQDPDYPPLLRRIASPPLALFVDGDPAALWRPAIAVVGSRNPTAGGRDNAHEFALALAQTGLGVVSGLAAGVDAAAHRGAMALEAGLTVAVLGTGPDVPYPPIHADLRAQVATRGAVVSEHLPGTQVRREHFPSRNRIIAGLALGIVVIEAAGRSGALITARQAADAGREVFALPGSIHNPLARGCHRLIREGATLVESAREVIDAIAPIAAGHAAALHARLGNPIEGGASRIPPVQPAPGGDDPAYKKLWQALGHDPSGMDRLVERTGLTPAELSSMLLLMELEGRVAVEHGRYSRKR